MPYWLLPKALRPTEFPSTTRLLKRTDGDISNVRVVRSSGSLSIDNSAVQWLEAQKMTPVFVNGQAQEFSLVKEIKFSETGKINQASLK